MLYELYVYIIWYIYIYICTYTQDPEQTEKIEKEHRTKLTKWNDKQIVIDHDILTTQTRYINRSLFELANCIFALCDGNREHVPFRLVLQLFQRVVG